MQLQMPYDFTEVPMNSSYYPGSGNYRIKCESAEEAMGMLEAEPDKYVGVYNAWDQHIYVIKRGCGFKPVLAKPIDGCTWTEAKFDTGLGETDFADDYTEDVLACFKGKNITPSLKRIGRGEGLYDVEGLKVCGDTDPNDLGQGAIGDCWLISSMSAVAEFEGMIQKLFVDCADQCNAEGKYTVRLFDLPSQEWKEYEIDDRIFTSGNDPKFCEGSATGEVNHAITYSLVPSSFTESSRPILGYRLPPYDDDDDDDHYIGERLQLQGPAAPGVHSCVCVCGMLCGRCGPRCSRRPAPFTWEAGIGSWGVQQRLVSRLSLSLSRARALSLCLYVHKKLSLANACMHTYSHTCTHTYLHTHIWIGWACGLDRMPRHLHDHEQGRDARSR